MLRFGLRPIDVKSWQIFGKGEYMKQRQQAPKKTFGFIFIAIFFACAVYMYLGYFVAGNNLHESQNGMETFKGCMIFVGVVSLAAGLQWPRFTLTDDKIRAKVTRQDAMNFVQSNGVIALAILESVAIYGLLWTFVSHETKQLSYSTAAAMLSMLYLRMMIMERFDKVEQLFPNEK
jgi:hypothetical protein